jgi:hypothetical protein
MSAKSLLLFFLFLPFICLAQSSWDSNNRFFLSGNVGFQIPINPENTGNSAEELAFSNKRLSQIMFSMGFFPFKKRLGITIVGFGANFSNTQKAHKNITEKYSVTHFIPQPQEITDNGINGVSIGLIYRWQYKKRWLFLYDGQIGSFGGSLTSYTVNLKQKNNHEVLKIEYLPSEDKPQFTSFQAGFQVVYFFLESFGTFLSTSVMTYQSEYSYIIKETNLISESTSQRIFNENRRQFNATLAIGLTMRF